MKPSKRMLGDKAYDSAELREDLHERGTKPVIPNSCNRKQPFSFSKRIYKLRWRIESTFNRFKDFRRIATRYDRRARNYLASATVTSPPIIRTSLRGSARRSPNATTGTGVPREPGRVDLRIRSRISGAAGPRQQLDRRKTGLNCHPGIASDLDASPAA